MNTHFIQQNVGFRVQIFTIQAWWNKCLALTKQLMKQVLQNKFKHMLLFLKFKSIGGK